MQAQRLPLVVVLLALALLLGAGAPGSARLTALEADAGKAAPMLRPEAADAPDRAAPVPSTDGRRALAQALLDDRAAAIERRDRAGFLATIDPAATEYRVREEAAFASLRAVPLETWSYEVVEIAPFDLPADRRESLGASGFTAKVVARYRIADYDQTAARFDAYYAFVQRDGAWYLAGDSDGEKIGHRTQPQLWDLGPITVVRGQRSIVLGIGEQSAMERYAALADAAVSRVSAVWGSTWEQTVVVIVPDTREHMAALLGADEERYAQIAAITRAGPSRTAGDAVDRIVINPALWRKLADRGERIVMTHEVTHVATRSSNTVAMPMWLSEGFADYLGYLASGVSVDVAAEELLDTVREEGTPDALPEDEDLDPGAQSLAEAYQQSWLAALLIAEEHGEDDLVEFYREVGTPDGSSSENLEAAFREVLETTTADFTADWRDYVEEQAR